MNSSFVRLRVRGRRARFLRPPADPFYLSASSNSNALVPAPANQSFTPSGTGNTTENVTVPVPAGLTPGNYTVTLNVGAFGSTSATLTVTAPPPPTTTTTTTTTTTGPVTPQQAPTISGLSVNAKSLKLSLSLNIAATLTGPPVLHTVDGTAVACGHGPAVLECRLPMARCAGGCGQRHRS